MNRNRRTQAKFLQQYFQNTIRSVLVSLCLLRNYIKSKSPRRMSPSFTSTSEDMEEEEPKLSVSPVNKVKAYRDFEQYLLWTLKSDKNKKILVFAFVQMGQLANRALY